jgi:hypothetical protein
MMTPSPYLQISVTPFREGGGAGLQCPARCSGRRFAQAHPLEGAWRVGERWRHS